MKTSFVIEPGQRFGKWTVLKIDNSPRKDAHVYWLCQCECGKEKVVRSSLLRNGQSTSCGCQRHFPLTEDGHSPYVKDISNQRFGKVIALYPLLEEKRKHLRWHCKCECGKEFDTEGYSLRSGVTKSCGCASHVSKGELRIVELLTSINIPFEREKTFETCRFQDTKAKARFDFFVNNKYVIEYDGIQHFTDIGTWGGSPEHDAYKTQWCKENNIPIIRIPYTHYNNLTIDDLKLETSNFII